MDISPKAVLAAVDLSDAALNALEAARAVAADAGATLEAAYALDLTPAAPYALEPAPAIIDLKEHRRWVRGRLAALAGPGAKTRVHNGPPAVVLGALAASGDYGLVVTGTHGYGGVKHVVFGSVAEAVVRAARVPVLTLPPNTRWKGPGRVLVPYNMTDYADEALRLAYAWCRAAGGRLTVVFVAEGPEEAVASRMLYAHVAKALGEQAAGGVRTLVRTGHPVRAILDEAGSGRHDLVVLSAHRKRFWKDLMFGMTAERVLRHSPLPVLAVPSGVVAKSR